MVTGVWAPEISGASLQCRALVRALGDRVRFRVLTTTTDAALAGAGNDDGLPVTRIHVLPERPTSLVAAALRITRVLTTLPRDFRVVHLHGFSRKSIVIGWLARLCGRRLILKLTSLGDDDALSLRARNGLAWSVYRRADAWVAVAPGFARPHAAAGLPAERLHVIPNGVDLERFRPASETQRAAARMALGLPAEPRIVLCVGFFSADKRPDLLLDALLRLPQPQRAATRLLFVGATESRYHEVDASIARRMRACAQTEGVTPQLSFRERLDPIEPAYQAADAFVLPSAREGLPNVLLEAMACGLPCIASRLPGATDAVIEDGANGFLVPPGDADALAGRLGSLLADPALAARLGRAARTTVEQRYSLAAAADAHLALYRSLAV